MLSIFPLRTSDPARYYIEAVSLGAEEYYLSRGEVPGRWLGRCSEALGLAGTVDADDLRSLLAGTRPDGGALRDGWVLRPGYDATFSAPKSVSVLYALGDRDDVRAVVAAHDAAVAGAIGYLERHACRVRRGGIHGKGVRFEVGGGMVGAAFVHHTSRAGDPQLHTHVLIANATPGPDGRWTGIDSAGLFAHAKAATAVYQALLRRGLVERLGLSFELSGDGTGDIVGVPAEVRARFSKRRAAIEEHMRKRGTSGPRAAEVATLATRQAKDHSVSELDLRIGWRQEADQLGFDVASVPRSTGRLFAALPTDEALASRITLDDATFDAAKAVWAVAAAAPDGAELAEIEERARAFVASPARRRGSPRPVDDDRDAGAGGTGGSHRPGWSGRRVRSRRSQQCRRRPRCPAVAVRRAGCDGAADHHKRRPHRRGRRRSRLGQDLRPRRRPGRVAGGRLPGAGLRPRRPGRPGPASRLGHLQPHHRPPPPRPRRRERVAGPKNDRPGR